MNTTIKQQTKWKAIIPLIFVHKMKSLRDHLIHNINQQKGLAALYLTQSDQPAQIMQQENNIVIGGQIFQNFFVQDAGKEKKQQFKIIQNDIQDISSLIYDNTLLGLTILEPILSKDSTILNSSLFSPQIVRTIASKQLEFCGYQLYSCLNDTVQHYGTNQALMLNPLSPRGVNYDQFEYQKCVLDQPTAIDDKITEIIGNKSVYAIILVIKVVVKQKNVINKNEIFIESIMPVIHESLEIIENVKVQLHSKMTNNMQNQFEGSFNLKFTDKEFIQNVLFDISHKLLYTYDQQGTLERVNDNCSAEELVNTKHIIFSTTFQHIISNAFLNTSQLVLGVLHLQVSLGCNNLLGLLVLELINSTIKQLYISNKDVNFLQTREYQLISCLNIINSLEYGEEIQLTDKELQTDPQIEPLEQNNQDKVQNYKEISLNLKENKSEIVQPQQNQPNNQQIIEEQQIQINNDTNQKLEQLQNEVQVMEQSNAQNVEQIIAQHYQMITQERSNNMKMQLQMINEQIYNYKQLLLSNSTKQQQYNLDIEAQNIKQQTQLVEEQISMIQQQLNHQQQRNQHLLDKFEMFFQKNSQVQDQLRKFKLSLKQKM